MKPTIKCSLANTYHRDGTVSYWDIYQQQWVRREARNIPDEVLASMNAAERTRIESHHSV